MTKGKKLTQNEYYGELLASESERKRLWKELCAHVSRGKSLKCNVLIAMPLFEKLRVLFPDSFDESSLLISMQKGQDLWEELGHKQANGSNLGNSRTWFYNMANRYGWRDKIDIEAEHKGSIAVSIVNYGTPSQPTQVPQSS